MRPTDVKIPAQGMGPAKENRQAADQGRTGTKKPVTAACRNAGGGAHRYDDMIGLAHHVSKVHPQMPLSERAAQFAPFAALSGHGDAIRRTQQQVEERMEHEYD